MEIRKATMDDLEEILPVFAYAREQMRKNGNPNQWGEDRPKKEAIIKDIENEEFYVLEDEAIYGCFMFTFNEASEFENIYDGKWLSEGVYGAIHKVASNGTHKGVFHEICEYVSTLSNHLRVETHQDNFIMQHCILKEGFIYCGKIKLDDGTIRMGFEK